MCDEVQVPASAGDGSGGVVGTITVVMPKSDRWFFREVGRGAQQRAAEAGHEAVVCQIPLDDDVAVQVGNCIEEAFAAADSLGAIASGFPYRGQGGERMLTWRRPLVIIGGSVMGFPVVSFDDVGTGRTSTQHLTGLGHQRIAHVTGTLAPEEAFVFLRRRARGYRMAMEGAGLAPLIVESALGGHRLEADIESLLQRPNRPTAVFAAYDEIAFVVMDVAERLGLEIGLDLSVVGVNGHPDSERLGLTTTRFQPLEVGAAAVDMILGGLAPGVGRAESHRHSGSFIQRTSSRAPRPS